MRTLFFWCGVGILVQALAAPGSVFGQGRPAEKIDTEVVVLTPNGFLRQPIRRPPGKFILIVPNRSGDPRISLEIDRMQGNDIRGPVESAVSRKPVNRGLLRSTQVLDLQPGVYRIRVTERPEWSFEMAIRPEYARQKGVR